MNAVIELNTQPLGLEDPLSEKEFNITNSSIESLASKITKGILTSEEILGAFIKRSSMDGSGQQRKAAYLSWVRSNMSESDRLSCDQLKMLSELYGYKESSSPRIPRHAYGRAVTRSKY